jgi:hypothetical protein
MVPPQIQGTHDASLGAIITPVKMRTPVAATFKNLAIYTTVSPTHTRPETNNILPSQGARKICMAVASHEILHWL